ncbi:hypothetical protein Q8A67_008340 [Cirrhinus molitorella]|uniref:Uncharacterized protein n=1 Tax=Cirrhinus molitorella TaxID=172907 RepID=A0AA88U151_9TELE|nr:hypothetical protein Q8A67_008340 [Cirrhinus molitorella]
MISGALGSQERSAEINRARGRDEEGHLQTFLRSPLIQSSRNELLIKRYPKDLTPGGPNEARPDLIAALRRAGPSVTGGSMPSRFNQLIPSQSRVGLCFLVACFPSDRKVRKYYNMC